MVSWVGNGRGKVEVLKQEGRTAWAWMKHSSGQVNFTLHRSFTHSTGHKISWLRGYHGSCIHSKLGEREGGERKHTSNKFSEISMSPYNAAVACVMESDILKSDTAMNRRFSIIKRLWGWGRGGQKRLSMLSEVRCTAEMAIEYPDIGDGGSTWWSESKARPPSRPQRTL